MVFAVEQWFKENRNIESYEMEDFLADVMNAEFDTIVEDDSLPQIATLICGFHRLYSDGKEMEIRERLQHLPRAATAQSSRVNAGGDDDDSDDEKEDNPASASSCNQASLHQRQPDGNPQSTIHNDQTQNPQCSPQTQSNENNSKEESMETEEEEGWQVVRKGKRR